MDQVKSILTSKTFWGAALGLANQVLKLGLDADSLAEVQTVLLSGVDLVSFALVVYGRVTAKARIA